jgi:hypothetical protein
MGVLPMTSMKVTWPFAVSVHLSVRPLYGQRRAFDDSRSAPVPTFRGSDRYGRRHCESTDGDHAVVLPFSTDISAERHVDHQEVRHGTFEKDDVCNRSSKFFMANLAFRSTLLEWNTQRWLRRRD